MSADKGKSISVEPKFFNRELSWLAFNERVLDQALSDKYPLLERTRFLSFVSSNLDQFYEIRVAGLMQKVDAGITRESLDGSQPKELWTRYEKGLIVCPSESTHAGEIP